MVKVEVKVEPKVEVDHILGVKASDVKVNFKIEVKNWIGTNLEYYKFDSLFVLCPIFLIGYITTSE